MPSVSVSFFLDMDRALRLALFYTLLTRTLICAGLRSSPEMVNYRLDELLVRSLIMCPNLPESFSHYL